MCSHSMWKLLQAAMSVLVTIILKACVRPSFHGWTLRISALPTRCQVCLHHSELHSITLSRWMCLWQHSQRDTPFGPFQDAHGFLVCDPLQSLPVDRHDLVPPLQAPILRRCSLNVPAHTEWVRVDGMLKFENVKLVLPTCLSKDCFDIDG